MLSQGQSTQTLSQIVGENVWFRSNFSQFGSTVNKLPFDHHAIEGLVAPRALLVIENNILWLGPQSSWSGANAARMIWTGAGHHRPDGLLADHRAWSLLVPRRRSRRS